MPNNPKEPVIAGGGIVFRYKKGGDEPQVLMIYRKGKWDLPKGKLEPPESIPTCAVREVSEEIGCGMPAIVKKLGTTYHEYPEKGKIMEKTTHWYSMILTKNENLQPEEKEGITEVRWMSLPQAIEEAGYQNLKEILKIFQGLG